MTTAGGHAKDRQQTERLVADQDRLCEVRENVRRGDVYIARRQFDPAQLQEWHAYFEGVERGSLRRDVQRRYHEAFEPWERRGAIRRPIGPDGPDHDTIGHALEAAHVG